MKTVEIAGGGLAGLALATKLGQDGWQVVVHEAADRLRSSGGGLYISRDGLWALDQIGQRKAFYNQSFSPTGFETWINGKLHRAHDNSDVFRTTLRQKLHGLLADAARDADVEIRTGSKVMSVDPAGSLTLADGSQRCADVVVAADGVGSQAFTSLGLERDLVRHQDGLVRVLLDRRGMPNDDWNISKDCWSYEIAPLRILYSPCSTEHCYLVMMVSADDSARLALPTDQSLWIPSFPMLEPLLRREPAEIRVDRYSSIRLSSWIADRVALIGDAAHAMPSSHARGANISLRNAVKLGQALSANHDIDVALASWETEVRPLTDADQREAEHLASSRSLHRGFPDIDLDDLVPSNMKPTQVEKAY
ncbi:MAG: NAD(P)/FAD-dependent oxidoreductase [Pseudomonadota bacterium]